MNTSKQKLTLERAESIAHWLIEHVIRIPDATVVGSIRRRCKVVGDIDIICPMPGGKVDDLHDRIALRFDTHDGGSLFEPFSAAGYLGDWIRGKLPMARAISLVLVSQSDPKDRLPVQVFRYDPGPKGNRGMIELIRTGPSPFSKRAVIRWAELTQGGYCKGGYLHHPQPATLPPEPTPDEARAFELLGWDYIEPDQRRFHMQTKGKHR